MDRCVFIVLNTYHVKQVLCQSPPGPVARSAKNTDFPTRILQQKYDYSSPHLGHLGAPPNFGGIVKYGIELLQKKLERCNPSKVLIGSYLSVNYLKILNGLFALQLE